MGFVLAALDSIHRKDVAATLSAMLFGGIATFSGLAAIKDAFALARLETTTPTNATPEPTQPNAPAQSTKSLAMRP